MTSFTIPADVADRLPTEGIVHIAVEGVRGGREFRQLLTPRGYEGVWSWFVGDERLCDHEHDEDDDRICDNARSARIPLVPPPVLSALLGKRCETCQGDGDILVRYGSQRGGKPIITRACVCAGTGDALVTLQRECPKCHPFDASSADGGRCQGCGIKYHCPRCGHPCNMMATGHGRGRCEPHDGLVSLPGRWKLEALLPVQADSPNQIDTIWDRGDGTFWQVEDSGDPLEPPIGLPVRPLNSPTPGQWVATFTLVTP